MKKTTLQVLADKEHKRNPVCFRHSSTVWGERFRAVLLGQELGSLSEYSSQPKRAESSTWSLPAPQRDYKAISILTKTNCQNLPDSCNYTFLPAPLKEDISFTGLWIRLIRRKHNHPRSKTLCLSVSAKTGPIYQKQPVILSRTRLGHWERS